MDSRTTWALDSGFLSYLDSGFQDPGFLNNKKSRIPDYLTRGEQTVKLLLLGKRKIDMQ
jgi:hypothetical protein